MGILRQWGGGGSVAGGGEIVSDRLHDSLTEGGFLAKETFKLKLEW